MPATLFVIKGKDQGARFEVESPLMNIGRGQGNHIQLNDTEVSRNHAEIRFDGEAYTLVDLQSANGTYINAKPISSSHLRTGDRVQLGASTMIFTADDDQSAHAFGGTVDIVSKGASASESQIIKTMSQEEGSQIIYGSRENDPFLARARSNLQVMYRTALAVSRTLDIDQLLDRIMELIFEWVDADRGCIMLLDQETNQLSAKVSRSRKGSANTNEKILISRTILDYVMSKKEGVLTSDAGDDKRWNPGGSITRLGVREAVCVPMQGRYGVVGVIYIDTFTPPGVAAQQTHVERFRTEHLKLMVAIGHQAALAIEDTTYYSQMVQAERLAAMGQTIATLSHHIKNILQGIRGGSYLIEEGLKQEDAKVVRRGWGIVEKNQEKISNLVMDMLTFSKEREPEMIPADLNETVADVVELMQVRAGEMGVQLSYAPDPTIPVLVFDPESIHRALLNIVTNAIDACGDTDNGVVSVVTEYLPEIQQLRIVVQDNGEGIDPEELAKIFSVFESKKGNRGTGLGLPVSQKILQEHDGDIAVESQLGKGSKFTLQFPAQVADQSGGRDTLTF